MTRWTLLLACGLWLLPNLTLAAGRGCPGAQIGSDLGETSLTPDQIIPSPSTFTVGVQVTNDGGDDAAVSIEVCCTSDCVVTADPGDWVTGNDADGNAMSGTALGAGSQQFDINTNGCTYRGRVALCTGLNDCIVDFFFNCGATSK